jgi:hypothetical protein
MKAAGGGGIAPKESPKGLVKAISTLTGAKGAPPQGFVCDIVKILR